VPRIERQDRTVFLHTVESGDTVWKIARDNGVTISAVVEENSLPNNGDTIAIGQELTITRESIVAEIISPVIPDPSVMVLASESSEGSTGDSSQTETPIVPDSPYLPLEPLVVIDGQVVTTTYVVKRGDTLWSIARANGTSINSLASLNSIPRVDRIFVGQRLFIPTKETTQQSFHRVQSGDTLPVISIRRSIALAELLRLNPTAPASGDLRDGTLIRVS